MSKERINIYVTERQRGQLEKRSDEEKLPMAEIIRRALDAYLAWDDPTYAPTPITPASRNAPFIPMSKAQGLSGAAFGNFFSRLSLVKTSLFYDLVWLGSRAGPLFQHEGEERL